MEDLIQKLKDRLKQPLPGADAHKLMMPRLLSGDRIRFSHTPDPRKGAVLILLYRKDGELNLPLIQRPTYDGVHSGQMALPGGKADAGDTDLHYTALREANEEIGILPGSVEIMGHLSEFFVGASNHLVLPVIGFTKEKPTFVPDPIEVEEIIEVPLKELLDQKKRKEKEIMTTHGYKLYSPYFDVRNKVVWGATAMMLSEFIEVIKEL